MRWILIWAGILLTVTAATGQQPWQQFSDPGIKALTTAFKSPPAEYGMILWWGWDGHISDTVIKHELYRIKALGFRGVILEGWETKFILIKN